MNWNSKLINNLNFGTNINNREAKLELAAMVAAKAKNGETIGFGSGSTSYLTVLEIGKRVANEGLRIKAIPTSHEVELTCTQQQIPTFSFATARPDWCFDGADEVDAANNLIKGRGGAMFKEKLIMAASPKTFILADSSKLVKRLGEKFPVPVEVIPFALSGVESSLLTLGATSIQLRMAGGKDGPVITENGNFILDVRFNDIGERLEREIKLITGVLESGLFMGYNIEVVSS
ncbi:MAG: ribose 5-phosphate isomerase A [Imperialibacter sp.]|uniref:ribose 5-phosphate isomerase A n=1 Tax=Imperialibacter sp. TaxID=2038411 RepID=UPI0032EBA0F5